MSQNVQPNELGEALLNLCEGRDLAVLKLERLRGLPTMCEQRISERHESLLHVVDPGPELAHLLARDVWTPVELEQHLRVDLELAGTPVGPVAHWVEQPSVTATVELVETTERLAPRKSHRPRCAAHADSVGPDLGQHQHAVTSSPSAQARWTCRRHHSQSLWASRMSRSAGSLYPLTRSHASALSRRAASSIDWSALARFQARLSSRRRASFGASLESL